MGSRELIAALDEGRSVPVPALARHLGVSAVGLYQLIREGRVKATKIGRVVIPAPVARRLLGLESA